MDNKERTLQDAMLTLFKSYIRKTSELTLPASECVARGLLVLNKAGEVIPQINAETAEMLFFKYGLYQSIWDESFYKSWNKVSSISLEELVIDQYMHYFSTYGREAMGLDAAPYIPVEKFEFSGDMKPNIKGFTVITEIDEEDVTPLVRCYFENTVSPKREYIEHIKTLAPYYNGFTDDIKSFEIKAIYYETNNIIPVKADDFLRYVIYRYTGSTLLIKSDNLINVLKTEIHYNPDLVYEILSQADLIELSKNFYRFKRLFLTFKESPRCRHLVNKIRKLAKSYHAPMGDINVQNFSKLLFEGRREDAERAIAKATGRQLIKLYNYLSTLTDQNSNNAAYNIRNGKVFINENVHGHTWSNVSYGTALVRAKLSEMYHNTLKGKTFYIPSYINYAVPYSEKQMIGNIPWGTSLNITPNKPIVGAIAWDNYQGIRTDLDLHLSGKTHSYGWNTGYRGGENEVIYSGDMTDATDGAVEAFYFTPGNDKFIMSASNFTRKAGVPFKFFMTDTKFQPDYYGYRSRTKVVDVSQAIMPPIDLKFMSDVDQTIGLFGTDKFYFYGGTVSSMNIPNRELYAKYIDTLECKCDNMVELWDFINFCGGQIVDEESIKDYPEEDRKSIIDLSPSALNARTFFDIVDKVQS